MIRSHLFWRAPFIWAFLALTTAAAFSLGAPSTALAEDSQAQARDRFIEGRTAYEEGDYLTAAAKFLEAYELSGRSELLYNVGQAYRRAEDLGQAELYFQEYLNQLPSAPNADEVVETIIEIQRLKAARMATLRVRTSPDGAQITVVGEDAPRCTAPCELDLDPGSYELTATLDGYRLASRHIDVTERQRSELSITLEQDTPLAGLHARADVAGATLIINGRGYSIPTRNPIELEAGRYEATIEYNGKTWAHQLDLAPGEVLHIFVPTGAAGSGDFSPLRISAVALGGASLALAATAILVGNQTRTSHQALLSQDSEFGVVNGDLLSSARSQKTLTNGLWIGAVLSLGAGAGLWTWDLFSTKKSASLEPTQEEAPQKQSPQEEQPGIDLL